MALTLIDSRYYTTAKGQIFDELTEQDILERVFMIAAGRAIEGHSDNALEDLLKEEFQSLDIPPDVMQALADHYREFAIECIERLRDHVNSMAGIRQGEDQ